MTQVVGRLPRRGKQIAVFARKRSDRGNLPGGWRSTEYKFRTFSVGYFAYAQYDVKKEGVSLTLNMTCFFIIRHSVNVK